MYVCVLIVAKQENKFVPIGLGSFSDVSGGLEGFRLQRAFELLHILAKHSQHHTTGPGLSATKRNHLSG